MPGYGPAQATPDAILLAQQDATRLPTPFNQNPGMPIGPVGNFLQNVLQGLGEGTMLPMPIRGGEPEKPMPWTQTLALLAGVIADPTPDVGTFVTKAGKRFSNELMAFRDGAFAGLRKLGVKDFQLLRKAQDLTNKSPDELAEIGLQAYRNGDSVLLSLARIEGSSRALRGLDDVANTNLPLAPFDIIDEEARALGALRGPAPHIPKEIADRENVATHSLVEQLTQFGKPR